MKWERLTWIFVATNPLKSSQYYCIYNQVLKINCALRSYLYVKGDIFTGKTPENCHPTVRLSTYFQSSAL